ncbi:SAVED domain-containing protein [Arthrobacter sp. EPSL27]|uniref:SAVED domain-containing protein n=1 Tax=Arthrobacter sp. EPSL27 TaxID=1745378 RepID=UPI0018D24604|nr:SAVED domain-containing protein [Arthrobacter sp. EPSL27]
MTADERAQEPNLFLLCHSCHKKIDSKQHRDSYTVEFLAYKKKEHEERVRQVTDFATLRPATVLRLVASVRGTYSPVSGAQISEALRHEGLTGMGEDTRNGYFEIPLPDPESAVWSWARAEELINKTVARVFEAIGAEDTSVLSVFAIAPVPVLIYLGSRLDDKTETVLHRRRREDAVDTWAWPPAGAMATHPAFVVEEMPMPGVASVADAVEGVVVLVSVSARVNPERIPNALAGMPVWELRPETPAPGPDLIGSRAALSAFAESWRGALSLLEATYPNASKVHLIAAVPNTAAVAMGRHHMRVAQPDLVLYQRNSDGSYEPVMEVR